MLANKRILQGECRLILGSMEGKKQTEHVFHMICGNYETTVELLIGQTANRCLKWRKNVAKGPIQRRIDHFTSFVPQITKNCDNSFVIKLKSS